MKYKLKAFTAVNKKIQQSMIYRNNNKNKNKDYINNAYIKYLESKPEHINKLL